MPNPMHLKGEPEPLDFVAYFSDLFDEEFMTRLEWPSGLTCSAMASNALNCFYILHMRNGKSLEGKKKKKKRKESEEEEEGEKEKRE